jgi:hypothetical protein
MRRMPTKPRLWVRTESGISPRDRCGLLGEVEGARAGEGEQISGSQTFEARQLPAAVAFERFGFGRFPDCHVLDRIVHQDGSGSA